MTDPRSPSGDRVPETPEEDDSVDNVFDDSGEPPDIPPEYWLHFLDDLTEDDFNRDGPHLISVDELRAAGALDVPPAWRKSLGVERDLFSGLFDFEDDDPDPNRQRPPHSDAAGDA